MEVSNFFKRLLSIDKIQKVMQVSQVLKINPNWLLSVIYFETARTFNPAITNHIGSVGLIQFTRDKKGENSKLIGGKTYQLDDIKKMTFIQQMDLVYIYYKPYIGKMNTFLDCYLVTFFPLAIGQPDSYVLKTRSLSANLIAKQNKVYDLNGDALITLREIRTFFKNYYKTKDIALSDFLTKKTISLLFMFLIPFFFIIYFKFKKQ